MSNISSIGRFSEIPIASLTGEQVALLEDVAQSRRGPVPLPYKIWLNSPALVKSLLPLGTFLLHDSSLTQREVEIAILVSAAHWGSAYVWDGHARAARELGLPLTVIDAIREAAVPSFDHEREQVIYEVAVALHSSHKVSGVLFERAVQTIGHNGISELTLLLGHYTAVAFALLTYEIPGRP